MEKSRDVASEAGDDYEFVISLPVWREDTLLEPTFRRYERRAMVFLKHETNTPIAYPHFIGFNFGKNYYN